MTAGRPPALVANASRPAHRRLDGLFDLELVPGPDGDLRTPRGAEPLDAGDLAELVRRTGGAGDDVRILLAGGGRHRAIFDELAALLGRDVLITPAGSEPSWSAVHSAEPTFVDAVTGRRADWQVVQPPSMATELPGWYDTSDGTVRERTGPVRLPLPGGVMLASRADFVARRAAAATLLAGHAELTTIGAVVRSGGFVIGDYTGRHEVADGRRLAASLAELPLYGTEVRMWVTWPSDRTEQGRLDHNLRRFAETTGAIVWAPAPDATTEVLDSCRDLSATGRDGGPSSWRSYVPSLAGPPRFVSDADGRLSPAGAVLTISTDGAPLISVEPGRWRGASDRYAALKRRDGLFPVDLTVVPDGRWAVQYGASGPHVVGPRELQVVLRSVGWQGEDLMLLATYPATVAARLHHYGRRLSEELRAEVWVLPPEADFTVTGGAPQAVDGRGRPRAWERLTPGDHTRWRSVDGILVPAPTGVSRPAPAVSRRAVPEAPAGPLPLTEPDPPLAATSRDDWARATGHRASSGAATVPANGHGAPSGAATDPATGDRAPSGVATAPATGDRHEPDTSGPPPRPLPPAGATPQLHSARLRLRHGIYWLSDRPRVNADPVDLYVVARTSPERVVEDGLPTPDLFAVGLLRPPAAESLRPGESLVRVRVDPAGAVDLSSIDVHVPPTLQLLLNVRESYLLPGGLLDRTRVVAGYLPDPNGGYRPETPFDGQQPLRLRCSGARHGVEGLPADVPRWPRAADGTAYLLLPGPRVAADGGTLAILAAKPRAKAGHRLLRLRVPRRQAIDVRAAAAQLAPLQSVRSTAAMLDQKGIGLVLHSRDFHKVTVLQTLAPGRSGWKVVEGLDGVTLADFLARVE
ncbi:hypothetical protein ACQPZK_20855 [Micromonospora sp. CA-249363]|uniref:hypothetical protein n=1 Tax=Micromonospora sp. CA-249363 TaxID=3239963 RepID=UPI003D8F4EFF